MINDYLCISKIEIKVDAGMKKHIGVVESIETGGLVRVKISRNQCEGCKLGDMCNVTGEDQLEMECEVADLAELTKGDRVIVEEKQSLEWTAIGWCLFFPFVLFFATVVVVSSIATAMWGVVAGLLVLTAYYGVIYLLGNRLRFNRIKFIVKKI